MTAKEKSDQISEIDRQLATLAEQENTANIETRKILDKRNKLNDEFIKIRQEIKELRTERDSLNEKVQTLKMLRDAARSKAKALVTDLRNIGEKITELQKKTPKRKQSDLQEELDEIEWKIQTTSLDLNEEKRLIEKVKQLETQLNAYKKIEKQKKETNELRENIENLNKRADSFHNELQAAAKKSQEIHQKMQAKIIEAKETKIEADSVHSAYLNAKASIAPLRDECARLIGQRNALRELLKKEEENRRKSMQRETRDKTISDARGRLLRGEKLSWDEFQLLNEDDPQTKN